MFQLDLMCAVAHTGTNQDQMEYNTETEMKSLHESNQMVNYYQLHCFVYLQNLWLYFH